MTLSCDLTKSFRLSSPDVRRGATLPTGSILRETKIESHEILPDTRLCPECWSMERVQRRYEMVFDESRLPYSIIKFYMLGLLSS